MSNEHNLPVDAVAFENAPVPVIRHTSIACPVVVWLDPSINEDNDDMHTVKSELEKIVSRVRRFSTADDCLEFIQSVREETIFLIVSKSFGQHFLSRIDHNLYITAIFVFSLNNSGVENNIEWTNEFRRVRGVFSDIHSLCKQVKKEASMVEHGIVGFDYVRISQFSSERQDPKFMYFQLLKKILLNINDVDGFTDMNNYCELQRRLNPHQSDSIRTFQECYSQCSPIGWYTCDSFLYSMLNRGLRTNDIDLLYACRLFLRHLHEQILQFSTEQKALLKEPLLLYRGVRMPNDIFDQIKSNSEGLLSVSSFFSTSANPNTARCFAGGDDANTAALIIVIVDPSIRGNAPYANISAMSHFGAAEEEYLFSMGSVFRVVSVKKALANDEPNQIVVTLTEDDDPQLTQLIAHIQKEICSSTALVELGRLMMRMGEWQKAEFFFKKELNNENDWQRRASTLSNLATVYYEQDKLDKSLDYFLRALRQFREYVPDDDPCLHTIYNNIGNIYHKQNKLDIAFQYLEHSLNIAKSTARINPDILATYSNNIACVLLKQGKVDEALSYQMSANDILVKALPQNHPDVAISYHNTAESLFQSNCIAEAIEYQQKAVDIALQSLPVEHPQVQYYRATLTLFRCIAGDETVIWESAESDEFQPNTS